MDYLLELSKIVDGALARDQSKVIAYTEQLLKKMRTDGKEAEAGRLERSLRRSRGHELVASKLAEADRIPVDGDSRLKLADQSWVVAGDVRVVLTEPGQRVVDRFLTYVRNADRLISRGVGVSPTMLLYGPPGCGKTETARWIASQLSLPLVTARVDALISSFLGNTAKNLRFLFEHVASRPCVLFLDEMDALAKLRDDQHELGELKRVVVSLLQNIDSLDGHTVMIAASNHPHLLDPAVWRRFSYKLEMSLPDPGQRLEMFRLFLGQWLTAEEDAAILVEVTEGMNGSDIRQLSQDAIREAVIAGNDRIDLDQFLYEIASGKLPELTKAVDDKSRFVLLSKLSHRAFPNVRLARLFNVSESKVSRHLKKEAANG
ncbi:MAG: AAA family ATPase [Phycisphaerae bacterium]|jgi:MoxR-like ATPase